MMQAWTPEGMAFLQDAMACCGYYPALARRIAPYLPKQAHVCDAGSVSYTTLTLPTTTYV